MAQKKFIRKYKHKKYFPQTLILHPSSLIPQNIFLKNLDRRSLTTSIPAVFFLSLPKKFCRAKREESVRWTVSARHSDSYGRDGALIPAGAKMLILIALRCQRMKSKPTKAAGPKRNEQMANDADTLIAFWDGESKGTRDMIQIATQLDMKVSIYASLSWNQHLQNIKLN